MGLSGNFLTQRMILERLDRKRVDPVVISPIEGVALDHYRAMGVKCAVIRPPRSLNHYGGKLLNTGLFSRIELVFALILYNFKLALYCKRNNISLIYSNCVRAQLYVGLGALLFRLPSFLYVKGELSNPVVDLFCLFAASRIAFMCKYNMNLKYSWLIKWINKKITVIEGGLDYDEVAAARHADRLLLRDELSIDATCINICVVGQICPAKGQLDVLLALEKVILTHSNLCVYFIGDAIIQEYQYYIDRMNDFIEERQLRDFVRFVGWRRDSLAIMSLMDILINPSYSEGFGYVPLEGMAMGLPVIATSVGVLPEAIRDGINGYLIDPGDVEMLTLRICQLLSDSDLRSRLANEGRQNVFEKYLIDNKISNIVDLWEKMV